MFGIMRREHDAMMLEIIPLLLVLTLVFFPPFVDGLNIGISRDQHFVHVLNTDRLLEFLDILHRLSFQILLFLLYLLFF